MNSAKPPTGRTLTDDDWRTEMLRGSELGRQRYQELVGDITDREAKVRTLTTWGAAGDADEAEAIISACDA